MNRNIMNRVTDKKYRASFKQMHLHQCWITGQYFTEYASDSVTGCHITIGRYGKNIKDDSLIIPLVQRLHTQLDKNQEEFLKKYFYRFPLERRDRAIDKVGEEDAIEIVKQMARDYYHDYKAR